MTVHHRLRPGIRLLAIGSLCVLAGCAAPVPSGPPPAPSTLVVAQPSPTTTTPPVDGANEVGQVPVLMYHRIVAAPRSVYDRTPEDFRAELERLVAENYVPVTAAAYASGALDTPAGTHPVVLTFDDGDPTQFALTPDGVPAAGTAVQIMLEVAAAHPGFPAVASFYVNADPFGDPGGSRTIPWLVKHGMEVGNHTLSHANLRRAAPDGVAREITLGDRAIRLAAPGAEPATISLPFGIHPRDPAQALNGAEYHYKAALLVGAGPAPSPYAKDFDALRVPRIRSQGPTGEEARYGSSVWLDTLAATPGLRYTSDGDPGRVLVPAGAEASLAEAYRARALVHPPR
ncbi:MAG: polysaccharide deacetylase family protein [Actinomycetota bacterium]|nr:polysaccharide deacetylase family protein [Actinomycetota bacterium]